MLRDMQCMLEEQEDAEMDVVEVDDELAIKTCKMYNYKYAVITPNDIVIPPKMINFKKIKYKNFLSTGNRFTEIDFQKHNTNLIIGTNGAGKVYNAGCFNVWIVQ